MRGDPPHERRDFSTTWWGWLGISAVIPRVGGLVQRRVVAAVFVVPAALGLWLARCSSRRGHSKGSDFARRRRDTLAQASGTAYVASWTGGPGAMPGPPRSAGFVR